MSKNAREASLRQVDLAKPLKRRQDYISYVETGQKLVEVVELMEWAEAIGFDPADRVAIPIHRFPTSRSTHLGNKTPAQKSQ